MDRHSSSCASDSDDYCYRISQNTPGGASSTMVDSDLVNDWSPMEYRHTEKKLDAFIGDVNAGKINLIPPFQRGRAWSLRLRQKLMENIVRKKPIPAIFLYKEAAGDKYLYNILDGKQRLESIMLFVGDKRPSLRINNINNYFFDARSRKDANFAIDVGHKIGKRKRLTVKELPEEVFRDFRDYNIPIIEIVMNEDSGGLEAMISLFVDINSYGKKVSRFNVVNAMSKDKLLRSAFNVIAVKQPRGKDIFYKLKRNEFSLILKQLQVVATLEDNREKVDRSWELLVELFLFLRSRKHRTPGQILKSFITSAKSMKPDGGAAVTSAEIDELRAVFSFLKKAYKNKGLAASRLAKNQIHFYTMVTSIIDADLLAAFPPKVLIAKLAKFGAIIDNATEQTVASAAVPGKLKEPISGYIEKSAKHTTHPGVRSDRQKQFLEAIRGL